MHFFNYRYCRIHSGQRGHRSVLPGHVLRSTRHYRDRYLSSILKFSITISRRRIGGKAEPDRRQFAGLAFCRNRTAVRLDNKLADGET
jgi:hypothetical protein